MANQLIEEKNQTHRPFENRAGAATRKFKTASKGVPPARIQDHLAGERTDGFAVRRK
jgi:hypothetical protein